MEATTHRAVRAEVTRRQAAVLHQDRRAVVLAAQVQGLIIAVHQVRAEAIRRQAAVHTRARQVHHIRVLHTQVRLIQVHHILAVLHHIQVQEGDKS